MKEFGKFFIGKNTLAKHIGETRTVFVDVLNAPKIKNKFGNWVKPVRATLFYRDRELYEVVVDVDPWASKDIRGKVYTGYAVRTGNCPTWITKAHREFGPGGK